MGERNERAAELLTDVWKKTEVAAYLKVSARQLDRLSPPIPVIDCGPRSKRYRKVDVLRWLEEHRTTQAARGGRAPRRAS